MLSRRLRLPRAGFKPFSGGFRATSPHFSVIYTQSTPSGGAVIVSKDVAKRAVDRHRVKRQIHSIIHPWVHEKHALVVRAKKGTPLLPFSSLKEELEGVLRQIPVQ